LYCYGYEKTKDNKEINGLYIFIFQFMQKVIAYRFSTIALISGAPKYDNQLASVAKTLKKVSKENVDFVGVAGSEYHSLFEKVYAPSSLLDNYEFEVTRAYNSYH